MAEPEYVGPSLPLVERAAPIRRVHAETGREEVIECVQVAACGHGWTALHLAAYRGSGKREAVGCEDCRVALFDTPLLDTQAS